MQPLIVEDSDLIRKVTRLAFPSRQHELHEAENGRKALEILTSAGEPFDAIVLDLQMLAATAQQASARRRPSSDH